MTKDEAFDLMGDKSSIRVITRSGIKYDVEHDAIECAVDGYVYGYRVNKGGTLRRRNPAGQIRWFFLRNVAPA